MTDREQQVIEQTQRWLASVVVHFGFCPFAKRELDAGRVRYAVIQGQGMQNSLHALIEECEYLDQHSEVETSLLIFPEAFQRFDSYLNLLEYADELMREQQYEGTYQLASFHPDYVFDGEDADAASNFTNRSPYPMLHLLRETSLEQAIAAYPHDPDSIPENNINKANQQGAEAMRHLLEACF